MIYEQRIEATPREFSEVLGLDIEDRTQKVEYVTARYAVFLYLSEYYRITTIARWLGRNHATVIYGIKEIKTKLSINDKYAVEAWEKVQEVEL